MSQIKYPFSLLSAFFIGLSFKRELAMPAQLELPIEVQVKVTDKDFPRLQINLRIKTRDAVPLKFAMELVGLFDYVGDQPERDRNIISDFVKEKGLHMLWPYIAQMTRIITGQMAMNPIEPRTPLHFDPSSERSAEVTESEQSQKEET